MAKEREERRKHDQKQRQLKYEAGDDGEWFPRKPLSLRILNPNACVRLKQILTVDNHVISLRHTVLNESQTTFADPNFDRSDFSGEIGTLNRQNHRLVPG
jgi:hypothetical protein